MGTSGSGFRYSSRVKLDTECPAERDRCVYEAQHCQAIEPPALRDCKIQNYEKKNLDS